MIERIARWVSSLPAWLGWPIAIIGSPVWIGMGIVRGYRERMAQTK